MQPQLCVELYYDFQFSVFKGFLSVQISVSLHLYTCFFCLFMAPFLLLFLLCYSDVLVFFPILFYNYILEACLFSNETQRKSGSGAGEEAGRVEEGKP